MQLLVKIIALWLCLCIRQMMWISQGSQLGLVVPDKRTDGLFSNMGRVRIGKFTVNGDTAELDVILEDTIGTKELWLLDFQPYRYKRVSPIHPQTGDLRSSTTGQCSNVEDDLRWDDGYFNDDFFQTRNSSGTKHLFSKYLRGTDNGTSGIRHDDICYAGDLETFMYCERSDGTNIWDFSIDFEEIQYTTILYATNVRPVSNWSPEGAIHIPPVAYVQTHINLVWRLTRIAMVNFVVSSVPIFSDRLINEIGRLLALFDFAIVEPILLNDGTPDLSRAHLIMGFTTRLPSKNLSMVVFKNGSETYIPEVQGNSLEEVVSSPTSRLEETPICNLRQPKYCSQYWEFEMILRMDLSSLLQELPLDAAGVFQFNFDSYTCPELNTTTDCELASDLPPWDVRIDLTLQTTVDAVDEDADSITLSIVKLVNDYGEDLRGGRTIHHKENITVEVNFSPAFLRPSYILELQLFMVCVGDRHMHSSRGCLGASEDKRYAAFVGDELRFTFDPAQDPEYQDMHQSTDVPPTDEFEVGLRALVPLASVLETYNVEKVYTREFGIWTGVVADSVFVRPYDSSLSFSIGYPRLYLHFLQEETDGGSSSPMYMIERYSSPSSSSRQPTIIADDHAFFQYFAPHLDQYHILETVLVRTDGSLDSNLKLVYSAFTSEPEILSYVGGVDPATLSCDHFDTERHFLYDYEPYWVNLPSEACQFLTELINLKQLVHPNQTGSEEPISLEQPVPVLVPEPQLASNQSYSQEVYLSTERDRILGILHLEPIFFDGLEELGNVSNWEKVNMLLYSALLFQEEDVILAFEPSGFLTNLRDKVRYFADEVDNFTSLVLDSVRQQGKDNHMELTRRLQMVSELTQNMTEYEILSSASASASDSSDSVDDNFWQTVDIDETFYYFLWNVSAVGTGHYLGNVYKTKSRNPQIVLKPNVCLENRYRAGYSEHCQMDWLAVIPFWVYTLPLVTSQEALPGGWGFWSEWGECSQSCGGGVNSRYRECVDTQTGCDGQISEGASCNRQDCSLFDEDGFRLVFKAARGIGISIYDLWVSSAYTSEDDIDSNLYKSSLVEEWADTIIIEEVKVVLLVEGQPVLELVFDGRDSEKMDWFSNHRLISSPFEDIDSTRKNYFSINGHGSLGRRFFISNWYNGCGYQNGWMVVLDGGDHSHVCRWEILRFYPAFFYSKGSTMTNFRGGQAGIADEFAVYIKYTNSVYIPPPPTLPPPILYTRDSISPPPVGSQLLLDEYDMHKHVHRSQLQNTVLSQVRNAYTMTTVYSLVSVDDERSKRDGHRSRRTLIASTRIPQLRSTKFISEGCPPGSEFNPIDLTCECRMTDWFYSEESFQCEPRNNPAQENVTENNVVPSKDDASSLSSSNHLPFVISTVILIINSFTPL